MMENEILSFYFNILYVVTALPFVCKPSAVRPYSPRPLADGDLTNDKKSGRAKGQCFCISWRAGGTTRCTASCQTGKIMGIPTIATANKKRGRTIDIQPLEVPGASDTVLAYGYGCEGCAAACCRRGPIRTCST